MFAKWTSSKWIYYGNVAQKFYFLLLYPEMSETYSCLSFICGPNDRTPLELWQNFIKGNINCQEYYLQYCSVRQSVSTNRIILLELAGRRKHIQVYSGNYNNVIKLHDHKWTTLSLPSPPPFLIEYGNRNWSTGLLSLSQTTKCSGIVVSFTSISLMLQNTNQN